MPHRRKRQSGFMVLLLCLTALAGMLLLGQVGLSRSLMEGMAVNVQVSKHQAFHLAEAGLDEVILELRKPAGAAFLAVDGTGEPLWPEIHTSACEGLGTHCRRREEDLANGHMTILVANTHTNLPTVKLTAQAGVVDEALQIEAGLAVLPPVISPWALFASSADGTGIQIADKVLIDSYDSRLGSYGAGIPPTYVPKNKSTPSDPTTWNADVWTNSGDITPGQEAIRSTIATSPCTAAPAPCGVYGDVTVGPAGYAGDAIVGAASLFDPDGFVSSPSVTPPPVTLPAGHTACPGCPAFNDCTGGTVNPDTGDLDFSMSLDAFEAQYSRIAVPQNCTLHLTGDGTLHVNEVSMAQSNSGLLLEGSHAGSQIDLVVHGPVAIVDHCYIGPAAGTTAQMYVDGDVTVGGPNSGMNYNDTSTIPRNFILYVQGERTVMFREGSVFGGILYAPDSTLQLGQGITTWQTTQLYGSFIGRTISLGLGNAKLNLHYDRSLNPDGIDGSSGLPRPVSLRLWRYASPD